MRAALLLFFFCGCTIGPVPDMVSSKGVNFFFRGAEWSKTEVDEQEAWFVAWLDPLSNGYRWWDVEESMRQVDVYLYPEKIECGTASPTGFCNGLQDHNVLKLRDMGCVFNSAYTHEVMHWLQQSIKSYDDYYHKEQNIWPIADGSPRGCGDVP